MRSMVVRPGKAVGSRAVRVGSFLEAHAYTVATLLEEWSDMLAAWLADRLARVTAGLASLATSGAGRGMLALRPYLNALANFAMGVLKLVRQHRAGRYLSNSAGAMGALAMARTAVLTGPLLGAMMYGPMEYVWVALGLTDMRVLVLGALVFLAGLIHLYTLMGFFD